MLIASSVLRFEQVAHPWSPEMPEDLHQEGLASLEQPAHSGKGDPALDPQLVDLD